MFSHYLSYLLEKLLFLKVVISRFLIILFRRRKGIELLLLEYDTEHLFDNSFIVINYRFRNAIYYRFDNHKTLEKQIKIFNIENFDNEFDLIVYGFFRKKTYKIQFEPQLTLNSNSFKTTISNLSLKLKEQNVPKLAHPSIYLGIEKPNIMSKKIKTTNKSLQITHNSFNQNEFI
jgi:hypothetical protein